MIADLRPYPLMKDSGVPWLGKVPQHWEVGALKRFAWFKSGAGFPVAEQGRRNYEIPFLKVSDMTRPGNEVWTEMTESTVSRATATRLGAFVFPAGSIIFPKVGGALLTNKRRLLRRPSCIDNNVMGCIVSEADINYAFILLQQLDLGRLAKPGPVPAIGEGEVRAIRGPLPPLPEQVAIGRYLDHADRRIRRYIRAKQKLITLLEEQKQAIIHRAVTGRIDVRTGRPYPAYKDSGVEWLGDVPEHWEMRRVKQSAQVLRGKFTHRPRNDPSLYDGPYPFIQTGEVARAERAITNYRQTLNERGLAVSRMFPAGTLVMTIAANIGDVAILDFEACFPDSVVGFVPRNGIERDFLYYMFRAMKPELLREAPVNTQGNLNVDRISSRGIAIAPAHEQRLVVRQIETSTAGLRTVTDEARREISLLQEYRTRLIADVVTGKLDVRTAAERLPEVDPLADEFDALTTQATETGVMELEDATELP